MIQDEQQFPFRAKVLNEVVEIVDMEWLEDGTYGLDFVCERNGQRHRVEARSVELTGVLPEGHLYVVADLNWRRTL